MLAVDDEPACSALIEEISEGSKANFIYETDFSSACCRWNAAKCLTKYLRKGRHCFSNAAPDPTDVAFMSIHLRDACEYNSKYVTVQCSGRVPPQSIFSVLCFHCITKDFIDVLCKEYCVYARDASGNMVIHHVPMAAGSFSDAFSSQDMLSDSEQLDLLQWFKLHGATAPTDVRGGGGDGRAISAVGRCVVTMACNDVSTVESAAAVNDARLLFEWLRREYNGSWLRILRSLLIDCAGSGDVPTIDASLAAGIDFTPVLRGAIDGLMYGTLDFPYNDRDTALEMLFHVIKKQNILAACIPAICRMIHRAEASDLEKIKRHLAKVQHELPAHIQRRLRL
jgi:hypothetical protein